MIVFLNMLEKFCTDVVLSFLCFQQPPCTDFSVAKFSDEDHDHWFSIPCGGTHFTCDVVVIQNQHINLVFGLRHHCCGLSATAGLSPMSFSMLLKWKTQHLTELTSMALSPHTLLRCQGIGMEPSAVRNSITTLCLVHMSTTSVILHCYCVEHMGITEALMILVELDSVTMHWLRQETLPSTTFTRKKNWRHYFHADLHIWIIEQLVWNALVLTIMSPFLINAFVLLYKVVLNWQTQPFQLWFASILYPG